MKEFWNTIQLVFTAVGGWLGWFLGGCDGLLIALVIFAVLDYITGVMCAIADHKLSSEVGFKGICRLCESSYNLQKAFITVLTPLWTKIIVPSGSSKDQKTYLY